MFTKKEPTHTFNGKFDNSSKKENNPSVVRAPPPILCLLQAGKERMFVPFPPCLPIAATLEKHKSTRHSGNQYGINNRFPKMQAKKQTNKNEELIMINSNNGKQVIQEKRIQKKMSNHV